MKTIKKLLQKLMATGIACAAMLAAASPVQAVETKLTPTGGEAYLYNDDTAEVVRLPLPTTYDLSFATSVKVKRIVLWMPSVWGGPVNMTAVVRGGMTPETLTTIVASAVYPISGPVPVNVYLPATTLQHLQIEVTSTHNGTGNLSEIEVYTPPDDSITSPLTAAATVGTAISDYTIASTNNPTGYDATNLPVGLSVNTSTGVISGTPTMAGTVSTTISATGVTGTVSDTLVFTIAPTFQPLRLSPTGGEAYLYNGNTAEVVRLQLPTTYDLSFDTSVQVRRLVLWMPSIWGGPVGMTAEIRGGMTPETLTTIVGPTVYAIAGQEPANVTIPTTTLQYLQIIITETHNGDGNLSEVEVYAPTGPLEPIITSPLTAVGTVGAAISNYTIAASDSPTTYDATNLPNGLSVNTSTGVISGTPTMAGSVSTTISATNANGTGTATLEFTINPISFPAITLTKSGNSGTISTASSVAGISYSLFYSDSLQAGSWLPVVGNPKAGGGVLNWSDDVTNAPKRFYRMTGE